MSQASDANYAAFSPDFGDNQYEVSEYVNRDIEGRLREAIGDEMYGNVLGRDPDEIDLDILPENFNWNDANGYSFFPEITNQGGCGDCYLHAFFNAFSSRIMIMSNGRVIPHMSREQQKSCNFYIEGCDGGLPINCAKWGWEFEFVDEE